MASKKSPTKKAAKTKAKEYPCKDCDKVYKRQDSLARHRKQKHSKDAKAVEELKSKLTPEREAFCMLYSSDREFFGNGVQSYIEAFDIQVVNKPDPDDPHQKTYQACRQQAHLLLTNRDILERINEIYEGRGLNDSFVDKQLEFVITQNAEFNPKVRAIQEYNKLKKRTVEVHEHTHSFAKYEEMGDDELDKAIEAGEKFFLKK